MRKTDIKELLAREIKTDPDIGLPRGHFLHWEDNVFNNKMDPHFQRMFNSGQGNELISKACAIHSSSMLAYNFFHWIHEGRHLKWTVANHECEFSDVRFEVKMKTLPSSNAPANMDIVLIGRCDKGRVFLFLESKFTEHFEKSKFGLRASYDDPTNYYLKSHGECWKKIIGGFRNDKLYEDNYAGGIKQNICHLIALCNLRGGVHAARLSFEKSNPGLNISEEDIVIFSDILFRPRGDIEYSIGEKYENFLKEKFWEMVKSAPAIDKIIHPNRGYLTYSELWQSCRSQFPDELQEFLQKKYMKFANPMTDR